MNPYTIVKNFERALAKLTGSPYAISVESCSAALFLSCLYCRVRDIDEVILPKFTYPSVPASVVNAGGRVVFEDFDWQKTGYYRLGNTPIVDSAKHLAKGMYIRGYFMCLSFHGKKLLPIGRGGTILTDNKKARDWLKIVRFDGRHGQALSTDVLTMAGWNMYMTPEQAARGLELLQWLPDKVTDSPDLYQDLSKYKFYTEANRGQ